MYYVYGVVREGHPPPKRKGVGAPPADVTLVESASLAAAVTELPDDYVAGEEDARAHLNVLIALLKDGTVIPLRMGTVEPDEEAVRTDVLDSAQAEMGRRLDALDGLVELHVDADDDESESIAAVAGAAGVRIPAHADLDTKLEIGQQVASLLVEHRRRLAEEILAELRPFAAGDTPRSVGAGPEDPVLRWAFLVKRDDLESFDDAVIAVRSHHPSVAIRYVGPLPPAHFVDWDRVPAEAKPDSFSAQGRWSW
ncbi:MAG TPA: GvpL/GvpF family gas vesicle protein [Jatrophihabitans sp.]|jgi:hypothetical protein|nr:GvpL/GvpF family gas vesicle protein [Jatrophihabitans sp.]